MLALLEVLENGNKKTLCFASKKNAERFKSFVNTYMEESGAGNGYDSYWVYRDAKIALVDETSENYCTNLNLEYIESMLDAIITARTAGEKHKSKAIAFNSPELPPRQRPGKGDMFRTLSSQGAIEKIEGRVLKDNGETFEVISCWDEKDNGMPEKNAEVITINSNQIMKINDWKAERRNLR
jgi:hypothetical protein